jgi:hypothetical protein
MAGKSPNSLIWFILLGTALGGLWAWKSKGPRYEAQTIFSVQDRDASTVRDLLLHFGKDISEAHPLNIFQGESLISLFRLRSVVDKALQDSVSLRSGQRLTLGNYFADQEEEAYRHVVEDAIEVLRPDMHLAYLHLRCRDSEPEVCLVLSKALVREVEAYYAQHNSEQIMSAKRQLVTQRDSVLNRLGNRDSSPGKRDSGLGNMEASTDPAHQAAWMALVQALNLKIIEADAALERQKSLIWLVETPRLPLSIAGSPWWQPVLAGAALGLVAGLYYLHGRSIELDA